LAASVTGDYGVATSDLSVHFLTPVRPGPARATATLVAHGTRRIVVGVEVTDMGRAERLAARATVGFAILSNDSGRSR
jgi:acyl-coenzyme A thioesterase PaaI-like protein